MVESQSRKIYLFAPTATSFDALSSLLDSLHIAHESILDLTSLRSISGDSFLFVADCEEDLLNQALLIHSGFKVLLINSSFEKDSKQQNFFNHQGLDSVWAADWPQDLLRALWRKLESRWQEADLHREREERLKELYVLQKSLNQEWETLAKEDALTGLANKRYLEEVFDREWRRARREKSELALVVADIDHFKQINDREGHAAGDEYLGLISEALSKTLRRPADFLARYGGEEFVVLLPNTGESGASVLSERLRLAVLEATGSKVSISLGYASVNPEISGGSPQDLFESADRALYQAKERGRNQSVAGHFQPMLSKSNDLQKAHHFS